MRRAQQQRVHCGLWRDVVGVAAVAANERIVFLAANALTDAEFDGSSHLVSDCSSGCGGILQRFGGGRKPLPSGIPGAVAVLPAARQRKSPGATGFAGKTDAQRTSDT